MRGRSSHLSNRTVSVAAGPCVPDSATAVALGTKKPVGGCFDVTERVTRDDIVFLWPPRIGGYFASWTWLSVRVMPLFRPPGWSTARDLFERDAEAQDAHYDRDEAKWPYARVETD